MAYPPEAPGGVDPGEFGSLKYIKILKMDNRFERIVTLFGRIIFGIFCMVGSGGCKKTSQAAPPAVLAISAISPDAGGYSTVVTIKGSGFNAVVADDSVQFNGVTAIVQSASDSQLIVAVPQGAGTGPVEIKVGDQSVTGPVFNYAYKITVSTLAGNGTVGYVDANGTSAEFSDPSGIALDRMGNVYVADLSNNRIRKIAPSGAVSTFAGNGGEGHIDANGTSAEFNLPSGVSVDSSGNIYVTDWYNNQIRMITPSGTVSTVAGNGLGSADGNGDSAKFVFISFAPVQGVAIDGQGNLYVADEGNNRIRKISSSGVVSTLAGSSAGYFDNAQGAAAKFDVPTGVAVDMQGNVYVADAGNNCIRKVTPSGAVSTFAGSTSSGYADGSGGTAKFFNPNALAVDRKGNIYVADFANMRIRMITPSGLVSTLAGNGTRGYADGDGTIAEFDQPTSVAVDGAGNVYVADYSNERIRKITVQ